MKVKVEWQGDVVFKGTAANGTEVMMEGPPELGGQERGPRPMEMLLLGAGGCSSFDVVSILKKGRQDVVDVRVEIEAERADEDPKIYTTIHLHFVVSGHDLAEKKVERAVNLSAEKYCSASIMLGRVAKLTHSYELVELN